MAKMKFGRGFWLDMTLVCLEDVRDEEIAKIYTKVTS